MGEVSYFFRSGLRDRISNFNNIRRETRNTLIFQKRQIDQNMLTINTPELSKPVRKTEQKKEVRKPNKRLEMLNKWKAEKERRKQEEQKKLKPLFKVHHVPVEVGLPNLENVNKQIKGRQFKSQFAPLNHKFCPPKNIKPISMTCPSNDAGTSKTKTKIQKINSSEANKMNSRQSPIIFQRNTRSAMSRKEQISEKLSNNPSEKSDKNEINRTKLERNTNISQKVEPKNEDKNRFRSKIKESPQKNTSNISTRRNQQCKDNPVIEKNTTRNVKCSSPKKNRTHEKPPRKGLTSSALEVNSQPMNKQKYKKNVGKELNVSNIEAVKGIKGTPKKNKLKFVEIADPKNGATVSEKKKSLRILTQPKLKEHNKMGIFNNNCNESADVIPKKIVGWDLIEIVESDDDVFSKENFCSNNRTPKRIPKKYKKTPRKCQNTETIDYAMEETLINNVNEEINSYSASKNYGLESKQTVTYAKSRNLTVGSATGSASPDYPIEYESPTNLNTSLHTQVKNGGCLIDTPKYYEDISNDISPKAGVDYFTKKLNNEITRIKDMCDDWSKYKDASDCSEEAVDMIYAAIGQSKLLMSNKFQQFRNLIDMYIMYNKNSEYKGKPVTSKDLHGFWDTIYTQVEDLNKRFNSLYVLKANNWQEMVPQQKPVVKRGRERPKKALTSSSLKDLIGAARKTKKSNGAGRNNLIASQESVFSGEFVKLNSPVRGLKISTRWSSSTRKSLRESLLANQAKSRMSSLTMMKISQTIKCGDGLTPSKSISKTDLTKSANRITK